MGDTVFFFFLYFVFLCCFFLFIEFTDEEGEDHDAGDCHDAAKERKGKCTFENFCSVWFNTLLRKW